MPLSLLSVSLILYHHHLLLLPIPVAVPLPLPLPVHLTHPPSLRTSLCLSLSPSHLLTYLLTVVVRFYKPAADKTPPREYFQLSCFYIGAMFASNFALTFVSYPTQALAKSCKMIPVMLMGIVINKKRYVWRQYLHVLLITAGISYFMLNKHSSKAVDAESESWVGLGLLFMSLVLDGMVGPSQDRIIHTYKPAMHTLTMHMNLHAVGVLVVVMLVSNQLFPAVQFVMTYPAVLVEMVLFSVASALGQNVIMFTLYRFNSLVLTTITTTRKFFTILASVFYFGHQLNMHQWCGVATVFGGLLLEIHLKYTQKKAAHKSTTHDGPPVPVEGGDGDDSAHPHKD
jgi:solute carrier family 35 (UDP-galactose transporter), member B1